MAFNSHSVIVMEDGTIITAGESYHGQLGRDKTSEDVVVPSKYAGVKDVQIVGKTNTQRSYMILNDGRVVHNGRTFLTHEDTGLAVTDVVSMVSTNGYLRYFNATGGRQYQLVEEYTVEPYDNKPSRPYIAVGLNLGTGAINLHLYPDGVLYATGKAEGTVFAGLINAPDGRIDPPAIYMTGVTHLGQDPRTLNTFIEDETGLYIFLTLSSKLINGVRKKYYYASQALMGSDFESDDANLFPGRIKLPLPPYVEFYGSGGYTKTIKSEDGSLYIWGGENPFIEGVPVISGLYKVPVPPLRLDSNGYNMSAGSVGHLFLGQNGELYAAGSNSSYSIGLPDNTKRYFTPTLVDVGVKTVAQLDDGQSMMYVKIDEEGKEALYISGYNKTQWPFLPYAYSSTHPLTRTTLLDESIETIYNESMEPVSVENIREASCGQDHTLLLTSDGTVLVAGSNRNGQLGLGDNLSRSKQFVQVPGLPKVAQVVAGRYHSLFRLENGEVYGCGENWYGELGIEGDTNTKYLPVRLSISGVKQIGAGYESSLYVATSGELFVSGNDDSGKLGLGNIGEQNGIVKVPGVTGVASVSSGYDHTAITMEDGTVLVAGSNRNGQLGQGNRDEYHNYTTVPGLPKIVRAICGYQYTLFLTVNDEVWGCGYDGDYVMGTGNSNLVSAIKLNLPAISQVAVGSEHSMHLTKTGDVLALGNNYDGQLGINDISYSQVPIQVPILSKIKNIWDWVSTGAIILGNIYAKVSGVWTNTEERYAKKDGVWFKAIGEFGKTDKWNRS